LERTGQCRCAVNLIRSLATVTCAQIAAFGQNKAPVQRRPNLTLLPKVMLETLLLGSCLETSTNSYLFSLTFIYHCPLLRSVNGFYRVNE